MCIMSYAWEGNRFSEVWSNCLLSYPHLNACQQLESVWMLLVIRLCLSYCVLYDHADDDVSCKQWCISTPLLLRRKQWGTNGCLEEKVSPHSVLTCTALWTGTQVCHSVASQSIRDGADGRDAEPHEDPGRNLVHEPQVQDQALIQALLTKHLSPSTCHERPPLTCYPVSIWFDEPLSRLSHGDWSPGQINCCCFPASQHFIIGDYFITDAHLFLRWASHRVFHIPHHCCNEHQASDNPHFPALPGSCRPVAAAARGSFMCLTPSSNYWVSSIYCCTSFHAYSSPVKLKGGSASEY